MVKTESVAGLEERAVKIPIGGLVLEGNLTLSVARTGIVLFAHGSGSSRLSPRNRYVAQELNNAGLATLLFDLLTAQEEEQDLRRANLRFNIRLLADRLVGATDWVKNQETTIGLPIGYFGASTGAAAALLVAAERADIVRAVVSRGGRTDMAEPVLSQVKAPTLMIVGGDDTTVIGLNQFAFDRMNVEKELAIIPGATHLFEEPGALEQVAQLATSWFSKYLARGPQKG